MGWQGAVVRNVLRIIDILPLCYLIGLVLCLTSGNCQRLSGTLVVQGY